MTPRSIRYIKQRNAIRYIRSHFIDGALNCITGDILYPSGIGIVNGYFREGFYIDDKGCIIGSREKNGYKFIPQEPIGEFKGFSININPDANYQYELPKINYKHPPIPTYRPGTRPNGGIAIVGENEQEWLIIADGYPRRSKSLYLSTVMPIIK